MSTRRTITRTILVKMQLAAALWLVAATVSAQTVSVETGLSADHAEGSFGRELTLRTFYGTGVVEDDLFVCTQPADVVLSLTLPAGVRFVAESDGRGVFDPATRTITWNLGTLVLDPDAFPLPCNDSIDVDIEVDAGVPDGAELEATAAVTTTSAGDDPDDNELTRSFQVGFVPLEVYATVFHAQCRVDFTTSNTPTGSTADSESISNEETNRVSCFAGPAVGVVVAGQGSSGASMPVPGFQGPFDRVKVGEIDRSGSLRLPAVSADANAVSGYDCDIATCTRRGFGALASVENRGLTRSSDFAFTVENPNPYGLPLRVRHQRVMSATCAPRAALAGPSFAEVQDPISGVLTRCTSLGPTHSSLTVELEEDGATPGCELTINGTTQTLPDSTCRQLGGGFEAEAWAFTELDADGDGTPFPVARGAASAFARARLEFALSGVEFETSTGTLEIVAHSPVDLLLTDAQGRRTGVDSADGSELGLREIPGCGYSGAASDPESITCSLPDHGVYELDILGTDDGPYTITAETLDIDGAVLNQEVFAGEATPGSLRSEAITVGGAGDTPPAIPGDLDGDGDIDFDDLQVFLAAYGSCEAQDAFNAGADMDGDGCVTLVDYQLWYDAYLEQQQ